MSRTIVEPRIVTVDDTEVTNGANVLLVRGSYICGFVASVLGSATSPVSWFSVVDTGGASRSFTSSLINEPVDVSQALIHSRDAVNNTLTAIR